MSPAALSVFHLPQLIAPVLQHARLIARGQAAVDACRCKLRFIIAARFLRGRKPCGGVWNVAPHQRQPQGGGGDLFQHRSILLPGANLAIRARLVMWNVSAMGAR